MFFEWPLEALSLLFFPTQEPKGMMMMNPMGGCSMGSMGSMGMSMGMNGGGMDATAAMAKSAARPPPRLLCKTDAIPWV